MENQGERLPVSISAQTGITRLMKVVSHAPSMTTRTPAPTLRCRCIGCRTAHFLRLACCGKSGPRCGHKSNHFALWRELLSAMYLCLAVTRDGNAQLAAGARAYECAGTDWISHILFGCGLHCGVALGLPFNAAVLQPTSLPLRIAVASGRNVRELVTR